MDKIAAGSIAQIRPARAHTANPYGAYSAFALISFGSVATGVLSGGILPFDQQSRAFVHQFARPTATTLMRVASTLGSAAFLMPLFVVVAAVLLLNDRRKDAIRLAITMTGATLIELTLKYSFHRPRPSTFFSDTAVSAYSFPSGHALAAFCFYGQLAFILVAHTKTKAVRAAIWSLAGGLVFAIGLSRVYVGAHYTSDVIGGYAVAAAWFSALAAARPVPRRELNTREWQPGGVG